MCPADSETNQCLIYAVLNVLAPDRAAYAAVTEGNNHEPSRAIVEYLDSRGVHGNNGYNALAITWYFQYLRQINRIRGYEWHRLNGDEFRAMLSDSFKDGSFILFGISPEKEEKNRACRKIVKLERQLGGAGRQLQEALHLSEREGQKHHKSRMTHAVGLRVEGEGKHRTLYDTGNKIIKRNCTASDLAFSVEKIGAVHRLRIQV